ncbi:CCA tRNA nucleotidyltransferase [Jeotgalibacillus soli]|uniref:CCA-adding enzyme n=1 Tax=Jeotgalibacillus soli TaxID=889306 RepID=A0A0C2RQZ8_9BACL|nr:CCA tRNA nucleotidyltransferase [Jeotgalibacillus soli]KIL44179.1 CCA tRNA nucleotidyltransferase [Jeotgalibacillus soli]
MRLSAPFLKAMPVLEKIESKGYEAYFVGGCVRDCLLDRQINDIDIATSATPEEIKEIFSKTVDVGIEHGTVLVLVNKEAFEITTFRSEGTYSDHRRPDEVSFVRSLDEDLKRRDFTMNAMALSTSGELVDFYEGRAAINERVIRTVGTAAERFSEDALRMLRAARFASQLGFSIDKEAIRAMSRQKALLTYVAVERKRMEFDKLLNGPNVKDALKYLHETDLLPFLPGFDHTAKLDQLLMDDMEGLSLIERWALIVIRLNIRDVPSYLKMWRHSMKRVKEIEQLIIQMNKRYSHPYTPFSLYQTGLPLALQTQSLYLYLTACKNEKQPLHDMWDSLPIKNRAELKVNGKLLQAWIGGKPGRWLGALIQDIEQKVIEGSIENNENEIKEWVKQWHQK